MESEDQELLAQIESDARIATAASMVIVALLVVALALVFLTGDPPAVPVQ